MKKLITMLLVLTMLATLALGGAAPAFAATATITAGGDYAKSVNDSIIIFDESDLSFDTDKTTVENVETYRSSYTSKGDNTDKTVTIGVTDGTTGNTRVSVDNTTSINIADIDWKKTGNVTLEYKVTLDSYTSTTEGKTMTLHLGLVPKMTTAAGSNKWPNLSATNNGVLDHLFKQVVFKSGSDDIGKSIYAKTTFEFTLDAMVMNFYNKTSADADWEYVATEQYNLPANYIAYGTSTSTEYTSSFTSSDQFCFTRLISDGFIKTGTGTAQWTYSDIKITENYGASLQSFTGETFESDDTVDVNFSLPENYASATLSIGGVEYADMSSDLYPYGGYVLNADLSDLTWYGNMDVVLDVSKTDGTTETLSSAISVVVGPDKTSYGVEDFEDSDYYYTVSPNNSTTFVKDSSSVTGRTGKVYALEAMNVSNDSIRNSFSSPYIAEGSCVDIEFDAWMGGKFALLGVYTEDLDSKKIWTYLTSSANASQTTAMSLVTEPWVSKLGSWVKMKFTIDTVNNKALVYCDDMYSGYLDISDLNGVKTVYLALKTPNQTVTSHIYVDNLEVSSYIPGNKPAVDSVVINDNGTIALTFDSAVTYTDGAITLKQNGEALAANVSYDADTLTATITPTGNITSVNGTVEIAESVAGYAMSVPVTLPAETPMFSNMVLTLADGTYTGTVDVYNDVAEDLGDIYIAIYNGDTLEQVASAPIAAIAGTKTFTCTLTPEKAGTYNAKMFIWNNALKPLTSVVNPQ